MEPLEYFLEVWQQSGGHWGWQITCGRRTSFGSAPSREEAWRRVFALRALYRITGPTQVV